MTEMPMPSAEMVDAARTHLAGRYAHGLEEVLWETDKYPLPDLQAIRAVLAVVGSADGVTGPDLAAALVVVQAARLTVDRLEADITEAARNAGISWQQLADLLELPSTATARARYDEMLERRALPNDEPPPHRLSQAPRAPQADEKA